MRPPGVLASLDQKFVKGNYFLQPPAKSGARPTVRLCLLLVNWSQKYRLTGQHPCAHQTVQPVSSYCISYDSTASTKRGPWLWMSYATQNTQPTSTKPSWRKNSDTVVSKTGRKVPPANPGCWNFRRDNFLSHACAYGMVGRAPGGNVDGAGTKHKIAINSQ